MINVHPGIEQYARPFTEIDGHPVITDNENADEADSENRVARQITRLTETLQSGRDVDITNYTFYDLLGDQPFVCPSCNDLLDGIEYCSDVREYGSATISLGGVEDYNSNDSETQDTSYSCPECGDGINPDRLAIYCSDGGIRRITRFISQILEGAHGPVNLGRRQEEAPRNVFYANPFMAGAQASFRPGALTGAGMATQCDASVPIATEDLNIEQDLFDN